MKLIRSRVRDIRKLNKNTYIFSFVSPFLARKARPGQFLHLKINSPYIFLRRPFSIHRVRQDTIYILFKVRGKGTALLSQYRRGDILDIIAPLGEGFSCTQATLGKKTKILVAGGIGVAPLMFLGEYLVSSRLIKKKEAVVLLGAKTKEEILCESDFKKLGFKVYIATEDGTKGVRGKITSLLKGVLPVYSNYGGIHIYACGPEEMFHEINNIIGDYPDASCEVAFEQFMGCGLGVCLGCVVNTKYGYKRVCKEGPVFNLKELVL